MGQIKQPDYAKFFVSMLLNQDALGHQQRIQQTLGRHFGPIDLASGLWSFDCTAYYEGQMGKELQRKIVSFEKLIDPEQLAAAKLLTNDLEQELTTAISPTAPGRAVNLDAGYLTLGQVILATTRNYSHRIYLRQGIYAEVTLHYHQGSYQPWPWTYPDYAGGRYNSFFMQVRTELKQQLKNQNTSREDDT